MRREQLDRLVQVLADRDIGLGRDDIQWAFESPRTEQDACAWVDEYLHTATLLSQEELKIYNSIPQNAERLHAHAQDDTGEELSRPFTDQEVQKALISIEHSTSIIENHTKQLEMQKKALLDLQAHNRPVNASIIRSKEEHFEKQKREKHQLNILVEELCDDLQGQSTVAEKEAQAALDAMAPFVNDVLQADDHLLSGLSKLLPKFQQPLNDDDSTQEVDQWCRAIISFRANEAKSQIETVCPPNKPVHIGEFSNDLQQELEQEEQALTLELDTLKDEIISVLTMVIDHEFRRPIMKAIHGRRRENIKSQKDWLSYIFSSLDYVKIRLDAIETHVQDVHAYNQALKEFQGCLGEEILETVPQKVPTHGRRHKSRDMRAPVNPQTGLREFLLGKSSPQKEDAAERLLRHFNIQPNNHRGEDTGTAIEMALKACQKRLQDHYQSTDRSITKSLAEVLGPADVDLQHLMSSVYGFTDFSEVQLTDIDSKERLHGLERAIDGAVKKLSELENINKDEVEQKRNELIANWS